MINNFQSVQWSQKNENFPFATVGYDIEGFNSGNLPTDSGSVDATNLDTSSTQSPMGGRHIFQLDDNPIDVRVHPCDAGSSSPHQCANGATCNENGIGYTCTCAAGFMGELCDEVDHCANN